MILNKRKIYTKTVNDDFDEQNIHQQIFKNHIQQVKYQLKKGIKYVYFKCI